MNNIYARVQPRSLRVLSRMSNCHTSIHAVDSCKSVLQHYNINRVVDFCSLLAVLAVLVLVHVPSTGVYVNTSFSCCRRVLHVSLPSHTIAITRYCECRTEQGCSIAFPKVNSITRVLKKMGNPGTRKLGSAIPST